MKEEVPKNAKDNIAVVLYDVESERNRKLDEKWALHDFKVPDF